MGQINKSIEMVLAEVLKRKKKWERQRKMVFYYGLFLLFALMFILFKYHNSFNDLFSVQILLYLFVGLIIWIYLAQQSVLKMKKFNDLRKHLVTKLDSDFCNCKAECNHKEEFIDRIHREYCLNLYYYD